MEQYDIGFRIRSLMIMMKRRMEADAKADCCEFNDVTHMNGRIICYIYENPQKDVFQKDIEDQLMVRRSTATNILKLMEKKGLIERTSVEYDARLKKLSLTDKAIGIHEHMSEKVAEFESMLCRGIPDEELKSFCDTLEKLKLNITITS